MPYGREICLQRPTSRFLGLIFGPIITRLIVQNEPIRSLGEAIAKMGHSKIFIQQLATIESEIGRIDERLAVANQPLDLAFSLESVRHFVSEKALDLWAAFDFEPSKARQILANHIERLVLTPRDAEGGPAYDVSGDIDLFGGDRKTMSLVVDACMGRSASRSTKSFASLSSFMHSSVSLPRAC
jgi:hypothetical protein